jgi:hypothetical protein
MNPILSKKSLQRKTFTYNIKLAIKADNHITTREKLKHHNIDSLKCQRQQIVLENHLNITT